MIITSFCKQHSRMMYLATIICLILEGLILKSECQECSSDGDVRLVGGSGDYEGNVQLCYNGVWGYICHYDWDNNEAQVVCKQLGYSAANATAKRYSHYGLGNGTVWLNYLYCTGSEATLLDCPTTGQTIGSVICDYQYMAGALCPFGGTTNCSNGDIRLIHFHTTTSSYYGRGAGRVEVCYNNEWGTVCGNGWDSNDATVACKQLGYDGHFDYYSYDYYGPGSGSIWLDDLGCSSSYTSLFDCPHSLVTTDCTHSDDVGVRCYINDNSACSNGAIKLWSAYDAIPDNEGIVLVCISSVWHPMWEYSNCRAAQIACNATGYSELEYTITNGGYYHGYSTNRDAYRYYCPSSATSLSECSSYNYGYQYADLLVVRCHLPSDPECISGDFRLVGGKTINEGRIEYCYNNNWAPLCYLNGITAGLICKQLGYSNWNTNLIIDDNGVFGLTNTKSRFESFSCSSSYTNITECSINAYSCTTAFCSSTQYGLRCYGDIITECTDGDSRLVDGIIEQEGRVEVCVNGVWSSICDYSWSVIDAYVFCVTLGYNGDSANPIAHYDSQFGMGHGPIIWSYVGCNHWNTDIFDCTKTVYPDFTCSVNDIAGVRCTEGCSDGTIRLIGSNNDHEGTVEICYDELWGLVSDSNWNDQSAIVVCNQLGYRGTNVKSVVNSYHGKPNKTIHLNNVTCSGHETHISQCSLVQLPITNGIQWLSNTTVAGVDCVHSPPCVINNDDFSECNTKGNIRLINNNNSNNNNNNNNNNNDIESTTEGRVEYCNGVYWTPLCTINNRVTAVICRELGHTDYQWGTIISVSNSPIDYSLIGNITCTGQEDSITQCTIIEEQSTDECQYCTDNIIGIKCFDITERLCPEDTVRLVNGSTEQEGRVEVCVNGVWGSICDQGWDTDDGDVVCQQLGYTRKEPTIFNNSYYGDGNYPIVYSNINCRGWETAITDCNKDDYLQYTCPSGHVAGLRCNGVPSASTDNQQTDSVPSASTDNQQTDSVAVVGGVLGVVLFIVIVVVVVVVIVVFLLLIMRRTQNSSNDDTNKPVLEAPFYEEMDSFEPQHKPSMMRPPLNNNKSHYT